MSCAEEKRLLMNRTENCRWAWCGSVLLWAFLGRSLLAIETITLERDGKTIQTSGRVLVEAQDGGLLMVAPDGKLWIMQPEEIQGRASSEQAFQAFTQEELAERLLQELPQGFRIHSTAHYVICYNTSQSYAGWCGALFERLYRGFYSFWKNRGLKLAEPEFPLIGLIFDSQASYAAYSRKELGAAATSVIGYYNMQTNRVTMYDLTGADGLRKYQRRVSSAAHINQILLRPGAERTVATIVHEATHQLAYNSGLQTRYADNPAWVSEGIAIYFETPDLRSSKGWRNIGAVNRVNLAQFRRSLPSRTPDALVKLLTDDTRFRNTTTARTVYADAWALNYFLLRVHSKEYSSYLEKLARQEPLVELTSAERVARFQQAFGDDLESLNEEFLRYMRRVR